MGQVAEGKQIMRIGKASRPPSKAQPFARQNFFGDRQQGGVIDLEVFRKHSQILILPGREKICNRARTGAVQI